MSGAVAVPLNAPPLDAPVPGAGQTPSLRPTLAARPPKAPPPRKAAVAAECLQLEQLPNIGPSIASHLRLIGVRFPQDLATKDAFQLYQALCRATGKRQDPCVLDTFMAAVEFMRGGPARPWWDCTARRKAQYGAI